MGRHEQREQVFKLLFRVEFHSPEDMPEQLALFRENNEEVPSWRMRMPLQPVSRRLRTRSRNWINC